MVRKIHRIEGTVMTVNSYLVEGANEIVVIDGMLSVSDARAVRRAADGVGKPIRGAIVTHAHPDHYAGFAELLRGRDDVSIVATPAVREAIERDDATKNAIVGPMMGDEWPKQRVFPHKDVAPGSEVRFGDLVFTVEDVGPGESPADSIWRLDERTVFVGDLVYAGMHSYLADGFIAEWLSCLDRLERGLVKDATLFVGHGPPGGASLIDHQRRYVSAFAAAVDQNLARPDAERRSAVVNEMKRLLGGSEALAFLMELSVDPFADKVRRGRRDNERA